MDRESGLTPARLSALSVLVYGGPHALTRLASAEDVAAPTMTRIVDGLVQLNLAQRDPHPDSARLVRISATARGRRQMNLARDRRIRVLTGALETLPESDRRRIADAAPLLAVLAAAIRADRDVAG